MTPLCANGTASPRQEYGLSWTFVLRGAKRRFRLTFRIQYNRLHEIVQCERAGGKHKARSASDAKRPIDGNLYLMSLRSLDCHASILARTGAARASA
jgi:hypothetical protein